MYELHTFYGSENSWAYLDTMAEVERHAARQLRRGADRCELRAAGRGTVRTWTR